MSLIGMLLGMGNPAGMPGSDPTFGYGQGPQTEIRPDISTPGVENYLGPDQAWVKPGQTSPLDILRHTLGGIEVPGGGRMPGVTIAPPFSQNGTRQGDVHMDLPPFIQMTPPPSSPFDRLNDILMQPNPISAPMSGSGGANQLQGNPMTDALAEQGFAPDSLQAQAFARLQQPAGAKSATPPKQSTPKAQNAQARPAEPAYTPNNEMRRQAISQIESGSRGGNYLAVGKRTKTGDRAYGRFQVMGANIPRWTEQVLGRRMSIQEFLHNPKAQDAVFDTIFGEAVQKYGEAGAANVWFTGGPTPTGKKDVNGTVDSDYGARYLQNLGHPVADYTNNNNRHGTGEPVGGNPIPAGQTQGNGELLANKPFNDPAAQASGVGVSAEQGVTPEQIAQIQQMSLKERLALLAQFMQLGGFKPGEGQIGG